LLIENLMDLGSSGMFPTPRQRIRDHTLRQFLPKLKIVDKDIGLALYCDLCRSLMVAISRDRFNVKKTSCPIPRLFKTSKVVSRNRTILTFFKGKRCCRHVVS
jgi:hypothetical protein